jgi:tetratricopeptide (TPR) repeat protein/predicted Ser/Thr protein kinase
MLQPGAVLGQRYEILQILGEGGMGAVYKARDRELNRMVALKVIRPELAGSQAIIDRFKQELLLATQVTHKNVIRIYDLSEAEGMKFITMEFVDGEDLRSIMQQKQKLSPVEAVEIMLQVCRALEAAHSVGIIHRDLKPQNIMRDKAGRILVMDFGLARTLEGDGMTQTGALIGTMDYMSPEQALGKDLDQRSDLFTLGLIFYELLTGKMPYKADSVVASLLKRTQERAAPVSSHDGTIPKALSDIVGKCMDPDVKLRYESSSQIMADLEAWQGGRAAATLTFPASSKPWGQTIPWHWIGGVAAVFVLTIVGFLFRGVLFGPSTEAPAAPVVSLAILPFRNASGDPSVNWMGTTVAQMLSTDMGESATLRTVPSDRVNQILHDLRVAPDATLDPDTLRRVAEFTSADRVLWGQYIKLGDQIRIDVTLQDLKRKRNFALKAEAASEKELPKALQQLAESVQKSLALPPETIKELQAKTLKPSSQSVQALRYYSEGLQLARQGKNLDAVKQFEAATKEDANFALAYSKLGVTYAALGYGDKAQELSRKAVDLSDQVSPQEKYLIQAEDARVTKDYAKAIESYENLVKILSNDSDVQYALARLYEQTSSLDKARGYYEKLLASDPKNVDALLQMGSVEIKSNNPQGSLDYLNRGLTLAVQLGNDEEKGAILDAIGNAYQGLSKTDDAIRNFQEALDVKRRLSDKGGIAQTLGWLGECQQAAGRPQQALKSFQEALRLRREIGDKPGLANSLLDLGGFYENLGQYDQALNLTKEALPIFRELSDRQNESTCLNDIGWIYLDKADYENAMTYFQQALVLRQKVGSPADVADSLYNIGDTYTRTGQYNQGSDYYLKALELWRKADNKRGVAFASYGLGRIFEYQGRYGAALTSEEDALKSWREVKERGFWLPEIQGAYGNALALIGRGDEAQKNLDEALGMARELKNDPLIAQTLNYQGDRLFYRGDFKAARTFFEQASQVAARTTDREQVLLSKFNLAKIAVKEGRSHEILSALQGLADQADRSGLKYLSLECSVYAAQALIDSKDYSRARQELDRSLRSSEKLGLQMLLAKSHYLLAETLRLSGNQAEGSRHYAAAHQILDDIRKEARSDDVLKRNDLATIYQESARWQNPRT